MSKENSYDRQIEKFLSLKFLLECFLTIPLTIYLIFLVKKYYEVKKMTVYFNKTFNYSISLKKKSMFMMIIVFSYEIFYIFKADEHILVSDQLLIIITIFVKIFCCLLIIILVKEQAIKNIKTKSLHILFFFIVISFLFFLELINEIRYEVFLRTVTFNLFGIVVAIYCQYIFIMYPNDLYYENFPDLGIELIKQPSFQLIDKSRTVPVDTLRSSSGRFTNARFNRLNFALNTDIPMKSKDISFDDISKYEPEQIPVFPDIKVTIKSKLEYNYNSDFCLVKEWFNVFYINMKVYVDNPFTKRKIKRNVNDLLDLDAKMKKEFSRNKYSSSLIGKYIPIKVTEIKTDGQTLKQSITDYINNILNHPVLITDDFIKFLGIEDLNISHIYRVERNKYIKGESNKKVLSKKDFEYGYFYRELCKRNPNRDSFLPLSEDRDNKIMIKEIKVDDLLCLENQTKFIFTIHYDFEIKTLTKDIVDVENLLKSIDYNIWSQFLSIENDLNLDKESIITNLEMLINSAVFKASEDIEKTALINMFFQDLTSIHYTPTSNIDHIKTLARENKITNIRVEIPFYTLLESDFKIQVFYEVFLYFLLNNSSLEEINLKYKYKELIEFIDNINFSLGFTLKTNTDFYYSNMNDKLQKRKSLLESSLNKLFDNPDVIKNSQWLNILQFNKAYQKYVDKFTMLGSQPSQSFSTRQSNVNRILY